MKRLRANKKIWHRSRRKTLCGPQNFRTAIQNVIKSVWVSYGQQFFGYSVVFVLTLFVQSLTLGCTPEIRGRLIILDIGGMDVKRGGDGRVEILTISVFETDVQ